jgi:hypothetical protein
MSEPTHSPAPWFLQCAMNSRTTYVLRNGAGPLAEGNIIATIQLQAHGWKEAREPSEQYMNAKLIFAAPLMADALELALFALERVCAEHPHAKHDTAHARRQMREALTAAGIKTLMARAS